MTEVARALVLPDLFAPGPSDLMSLLLVWDELELEKCDYHPAWPSYPDFRAALREAGVVREFPPPFEIQPVADPTLSDDETEDELEERARGNGLMLAEGIRNSVEDAQIKAHDRGLAPVAMTQFAHLASALPPLDPSSPVAEATMIQVAAKGLQLEQTAELEAVLKFREKNRGLMGRFRGAMIDLSAEIDSDTPAKVAEQAYALMNNRVEPLLGDLASALSRGRLSFFVRTLFGATAVALTPTDPAAKAIAGGAIVTRSLKYAFDRGAVVREHPYGLLYQVHLELSEEARAQPPPLISDPDSALADACFKLMHNLSSYLRRSMNE